MSPVHASRVTTTRLARRWARLLGARLAAAGPTPQRLSVTTPARPLRNLSAAAAEASIYLAERPRLQVVEPLGSNAAAWSSGETLAGRATKPVPRYPARPRAGRGR